MNTSTSLLHFRRASIRLGGLLAIVLLAGFAMPVQAASAVRQVKSTARSLTMHLCERFCGHHHHHHAHTWCSGGQDYRCPGH